ncbi:MAG TPA: flagellar biosynthetic protein FliO [Burkholderiaceae bacterium]
MSVSSILVVLGLFAVGACVAWRNWQRHPARKADGWRMETLAQLPFGPRERLVLVRVADRLLVLGVTSQHISLLRELEAAPSGAESENQPAAEPSPGGGFAALLRNTVLQHTGDRA